MKILFGPATMPVVTAIPAGGLLGLMVMRHLSVGGI